MNTAATVLLAIANELAQRAKDSMPKLREGERVRREWLDDGVYYRETFLNGETFISQYDFREGEVLPTTKATAPKKQSGKKKATA